MPDSIVAATMRSGSWPGDNGLPVVSVCGGMARLDARHIKKIVGNLRVWRGTVPVRMAGARRA